MSADEELVSDSALIDTTRDWMKRWATPAERHELAPLLHTYEVLLIRANSLTEAYAGLQPVRNAPDAARLQTITDAQAYTTAELARQRLAIRTWMTNRASKRIT